MKGEGEEAESFYKASRRKFAMRNEKVKHLELDSRMETEDG